MSIAHKPSIGSKRKAVGKGAGKQRRGRVEGFDPVADAEACRKISQGLDVKAFDAALKRNTSQKYWQAKE